VIKLIFMAILFMVMMAQRRDKRVFTKSVDIRETINHWRL